MLNIVIPMAGAGSRFVSAGYADPKPLVRIHGVPMIRVVIDNLTPKEEHRFIFICQQAHLQAYALKKQLERWAPGSAVIPICELTQGAACSVLCAKQLINSDDELMIANSDQYVDVDINEYLHAMRARKLDGQIMTMKATDPKWSFIRMSDLGYVITVAEKVVVSDEATTGVYNFSNGRAFVAAAELMVEQELRANGEFYVAPTYNVLIRDGAKVGYFNIGRDGAGMYGLGTPDDLNKFVSLGISKNVSARLQSL